MALTRSTIREYVRPELREAYNSILRVNCNSNICYAPTLDRPDYYLVERLDYLNWNVLARE